MQEFSDAELVAKFIAGDNLALDELIRRYFRQVFLFAKTYVKTDMEAEDMTQEVFVKLWKNAKKYDPEKKFKTWLFQITKNTCIDSLRKRKMLLNADSLDEEQMLDNLENMADKNPLPEQLLDSQGFAAQVQKILDQLPKAQSEAVAMHLQQDLTFQEIAEILDQPLNTIKSRYRRALLTIREQLSKNTS